MNELADAFLLPLFIGLALPNIGVLTNPFAGLFSSSAFVGLRLTIWVLFYLVFGDSIIARLANTFPC